MDHPHTIFISRSAATENPDHDNSEKGPRFYNYASWETCFKFDVSLVRFCGTLVHQLTLGAGDLKGSFLNCLVKKIY